VKNLISITRRIEVKSKVDIDDEVRRWLKKADETHYRRDNDLTRYMFSLGRAKIGELRMALDLV
jgi:hypothetical protein